MKTSTKIIIVIAIVLIIGGVVGYYFWSKKKAASTTETPPTQTTPVNPMTGGAMPNILKGIDIQTLVAEEPRPALTVRRS